MKYQTKLKILMKKCNILQDFLVPILATKEALAPLAHGPIIWGRLIQSFRHLECQNLSIISDSIGSPRWLQKMQK